MASVEHLLILETNSIQDALIRLDKTAQGLLLLVDGEGKLLRTVTDGDLRRLILAGTPLGAELVRLPEKPPLTLPAGAEPAVALELMNLHQVDQLPLVDGESRPYGLFLRRDLSSPILLSTPHLGDEERTFVEEAFQTNWIAPLGPNVDAFEKELANHVGIAHAAAVSSGTAAIHLALDLLDVRPGDRVLCSSLTFVASVNPILYRGGVPVFIDSDPATWNMSVPALARALADAEAKGELPVAAIVVNLYGQSADMAPILELCNAYQIPVVEDAAESLGATYQGKASGTWGRLGIYSFNGNKIITTSGGGMLVSEDGELMEKARFLSTQARDPAPWYQHTQVGYNYRMSNILAGVGRGQLKVLEQRVASRRRVFESYQRYLSDLPGLGWMPEADFGRSTRWLSVCTLDPAITEMTPSRLIHVLRQHNIEARYVWNPMHNQPLFAHAAYYSHGEDNSFSDWAFQHGVCLPSGSNLQLEQIERVCKALRQAML